MKSVNWKTTTYEFADGFMVDIVDTGDMYEAWLFHKNVGIKDLMFGVFKDETPEEMFLDMVADNLNYENYIVDYQREYMMEEE